MEKKGRGEEIGKERKETRRDGREGGQAFRGGEEGDRKEAKGATASRCESVYID